jgi:hypothetical protein
MLEVKRHLDGCRTCMEEYMMLRQVKILLRSVSMKEPGPLFEARIQAQLAAERQGYGLSLPLPAINFNNRGRRLAYAMALSCVGILSLAHATSTKTALSDVPMRPVLDAQIPTAILTDLEGENITTAFRVPAHPPVQNTFITARPDMMRAHRSYNFIGGFSSPMSVYSSSAVSFAGYGGH